MARVATPAFIRQIETLFDSGSVVGLTDRQLLDRFNAARGADAEAAFAALVGRHGTMVLRVCLQILRDQQHAEDAFQAVFLVLARKARSIHDPDKLPNWLHGVALRTARCIKPRIDLRIKRDGDGLIHHSRFDQIAEPASTASPEQIALDREQAELLHREILRLPRNFRLPIMLCHFQGLSLNEAAIQLDWPQGTLCSRLARARARLRQRLTQRGVSLSTAAFAAFLSSSRCASAHVSSRLCHATAEAAVSFASQQAAGAVLSTSVTLVAAEVLRGMAWKTTIATMFSLVTLVSFASAFGYLSDSFRMRTDDPTNPPPAANQPLTARPLKALGNSALAAAKPKQAPPERMLVTGRVLDPDGKPTPKAIVNVLASRGPVRIVDGLNDDRLSVMGGTKTDAGGRIRLETPRASSNQHESVVALASAPGFGLGWARLNPDADQPAADIRLMPEQPLHLRLVDIRGLPTPNVEIAVQRLWRSTDNIWLDGIELPAKPHNASPGLKQPVAEIQSWPQPVTTDLQGKAIIPGIGRGTNLRLNVRDPRYASHSLEVEASQFANAKEVILILQLARTIEGRVLDADTGQPIPHAMVVILGSAGPFGMLTTTKFQADDRGRFTANPSPDNYFRLYAYAPEAQHYEVPRIEFAWTKGMVKKVIDIHAPRGVLVQGKVTEQGTGRPLPGSKIHFMPSRSNDNVISGSQAMVSSQQDGSFQVPVPAGKGYLFIFGPSSDYVLTEIGTRTIFQKGPGGERYRAHAIIPYEAKPGDPARPLVAELRPAVTIKGRVEGPQGQPVSEAALVSLLHIEPTLLWWRGNHNHKVRDGRFELHGVDPNGSAKVYMLDSEHQWGATVELSGKQSGEDVLIRLAPSGQAKARFVGPDGHPLPKTRVSSYVKLLLKPGPDLNTRDRHEQAMLAAVQDYLANIERKYLLFADQLNTDANGDFSSTSLIPGATYRITDWSTVNNEKKGPRIRQEFTVKSGEMRNLGDILIEESEQ